MKTVVLISNEVMHYRISVYNFFQRSFKRYGWRLVVLTDRVQPENVIKPEFELREVPFHFSEYRRELKRIRPDAVILFLHLRDRIVWPLLHWLKMSGVPVAFWTKTRNLDDPNNVVRNVFFNYVHFLCDGLILYAADLIRNVPRRARHKVFVANNTLNFHDYPEITETKEQIKEGFGIHFKHVVLFVGRMGVERGRKRVDHLIEIFRDFPRNDTALVLVGSGLREEWRKRLNPENTFHLGEVHDPEHRQISRIFKMADISAIPGHVGLGINQAFYWGLPVVTEHGNQPPEVGYLKAGRNGFIVAENDLAALREKILFLLDNPTILQEFSAAARADILAEGSIERMCAGFINCLQYITGAQVSAAAEVFSESRSLSPSIDS